MTDYIPAAKILRVVTLIEKMKEDGMTLKQIEVYLDVSNRTAYRYKDLIEAAGFELERDRKVYRIVGRK